MVLSRGIVGDQGGTPKVACPFHKKTFDLTTGEGLNDPDLSISTFKTKVDGGFIWAELPEVSELEETFKRSECAENCATAAE